MKFYEKLTLLMNVTKTTNQELAVYSRLDASYISRIKNGKRKPVKGAPYFQVFSQFLAKRINSPDQLELIKIFLNCDSFLSFNNENLADTLYYWLTEDYPATELLEVPPFEKVIYAAKAEKKEHVVHSSCSIYFKTQGKRLAALNFLERIIANEVPQNLLFFSDEDLDWMVGDPVFANQWSRLVKTILMKGNRIRIIHDLNRGLDEILAAIRYWIPLYMTGSIEPFYYPRIRDGIYKRSVYIAPGSCAVTSNSIGNMGSRSDEAATFLFTDKRTIAALQTDFNNYLALCRPLMNVLCADKSSSHLDFLIDFEEKTETTIIKTTHLSALSMPESVLLSIAERNPQVDVRRLLAFHQFRMKRLEKILQDYSVTEIFSIPSLDSLYRREIAVDHSIGLEEETVYYTGKEYRMHLEHVLHLLKSYENYHVSLETTAYDLGYSISSKENAGVMVIKNAPPLVFLSAAENKLAVGFQDFLLKLSQKNEVSRTSAIKQLKSFIEDLA